MKKKIKNNKNTCSDLESFTDELRSHFSIFEGMPNTSETRDKINNAMEQYLIGQIVNQILKTNEKHN